MKRAVFWDRDGVINELVARDGGYYGPRNITQLKLSKDIGGALAQTRALGFLNIVFTNQPDLARGLMTKNELEAIHQFIQAKLPLDGIMVCAHDSGDNCSCRKPKPGLLLEAARRWGINLNDSFVVGDAGWDMEAGERAGCVSILLETPHSARYAHALRAKSLTDVVQLIQARLQKQGNSTIRQAVILSAGLGTRLQPFTNDKPKVMIPILGKPLLEWQIEQFKRHGVTKFFINRHYLPEVISDYFGDGSGWGVTICYSRESTPLGTAGGIKNFESQLDSVFFVIYGDTFSLVDYTKMAAAWAKKPDAIGMQRTAPTKHYDDADVVELDQHGQFVALHAKPHAKQYPNAHRLRGISILRKRILSYIPSNTYYEIGKHLLPDVIARGEHVYGYECAEYSKGIDTLEKWQEVEAYLRTHHVSSPIETEAL